MDNHPSKNVTPNCIWRTGCSNARLCEELGFCRGRDADERARDLGISPSPSKNDFGALIRRVNARIPNSVTPATRIEIHPSEWIELSNAFLESREQPAVETGAKSVEITRLHETFQEVMALLADWLDADRFNNIEARVLEAGVPYPPLKSEPKPVCPDCKTELAFEGDTCGLCNPEIQK